jgi:hypothetical protein
MFHIMSYSFLRLDLCVVSRYIWHIQIRERNLLEVRKYGVEFNNAIEVLWISFCYKQKYFVWRTVAKAWKQFS